MGKTSAKLLILNLFSAPNISTLFHLPVFTDWSSAKTIQFTFLHFYSNFTKGRYILAVSSLIEKRLRMRTQQKSRNSYGGIEHGNSTLVTKKTQSDPIRPNPTQSELQEDARSLSTESPRQCPAVGLQTSNKIKR